MEKVKKEIYKNHKIVIYRDEDYESPNEWGDDERFLVHYHRQCWITNKLVEKEDIADWYRRGCNKKYYMGNLSYWIWPVAAYIHSGVVLSLGSGRHFPDYNWDVSHVGAVLVKGRKGLTEKKARTYAEGLIETWNQYLSGDVYGFRLFSLDENGKKLEEIDSCWGFYGEEGIKQIIEECKSRVDYQLEKKMQIV